jgi:hypothetical protein
LEEWFMTEELTDQQLIEIVAKKLGEGKRLRTIAKELRRDKAWLSRKIKESGYSVEWQGRLVKRDLPNLNVA